MPWIVAVYPHFQAHPNNIMLIMYPMINPVKFTLYYHNIKMMIPLKLYIYVQWNTLARPESPTKLKRCWTWWRQRGHRTCSSPPFRWKYGAFTSYHVVSPCFLCFAWGGIDCSDFWGDQYKILLPPRFDGFLLVSLLNLPPHFQTHVNMKINLVIP